MNISNFERSLEDINSLLALIVNDRTQVFFTKTNVIKPDFANKELSFVRLVSWLYTLYFETGKTSLGVIQKAMSLESQALLKLHKTNVQSMRTKLQHNLDKVQSARDFKIETSCMAWTKLACGKNIPNSEDDWLACSMHLLTEAESILALLKSTLEEMTDSVVNKDIFVVNWGITTMHDIPVHYFDKHIEEFIQFTDIEDFDTVAYRTKNLAAWRNYITGLKSTANYPIEIKKVVESSLVRDFIFILPITLDDLHNFFILSRDLIRELYTFINTEPDIRSHNKDILVKILKDKFSHHLK